ncbi:hypothetical protein BKA61DRAFT_679683 [Leptodontidium sp. MPI-SDFR-AT-0119]|nr:hypothetical protein BKA61DRAFT_679683 [Leptodontidium sp. MPI-SDFR-AT-0119]
MQFHIIALTLAAASGIAASPALTNRNLHVSTWCADVDKAVGFKEGDKVTENNDATQKACDFYRSYNRGTGLQQDSCPDCVVFTNEKNGFKTCASAGRHIGGNEWNGFCKGAGAYMGKVS